MLSKKYAKNDLGRCVACGACEKECPRTAIEIWKGCYAKMDITTCVGCGRCVSVCPTGSVTLVEREDDYEG